MTSSTTIGLLRKSFSNLGLPDEAISDNAPYFVLEEVRYFYNKNAIVHITHAPSNGQAERAVRTLKEGQ